MRIPAACLLMALALPASAQIYSYTDASGNQVFTNQPPDGIEAAPVQLQPMNTMDPTRVETPAAAPETAPVDGQSLPYTQLMLTDLPTDEAMRANSGSFTVRAALQPGLRPGHQLQLLLDGQPYGTPSNVPLLQLTDIGRGEHSLELQVKEGDKVLQQSMPVTFTVQRVALGAPPKAVKPPSPPLPIPPKPTPRN